MMDKYRSAQIAAKALGGKDGGKGKGKKGEKGEGKGKKGEKDKTAIEKATTTLLEKQGSPVTARTALVTAVCICVPPWPGRYRV